MGCVSFYLSYRSPYPHSSRKNAHKINIMDVLVLEHKQSVSGHIDNRQQKHYSAHTRTSDIFSIGLKIKNQIKNQYIRCANTKTGQKVLHLTMRSIKTQKLRVAHRVTSDQCPAIFIYSDKKINNRINSLLITDKTYPATPSRSCATGSSIEHGNSIPRFLPFI